MKGEINDFHTADNKDGSITKGLLSREVELMKSKLMIFFIIGNSHRLAYCFLLTILCQKLFVFFRHLIIDNSVLA